MSLANLGDLKMAVAEWLYRAGDAGLAARAGDLIGLFESDFVIDPEMRTFEMEVVSTTPITSAITALPANYIDMIRLQVIGQINGTPNVVLDYRTPSQAALLDATTCNSGTPKNYTTLASQIIFCPQKWVPIGATLEMAYYAFTPLAMASGGANWLIAKYPNLYLYGTLMQVAGYIDDKDTVAFWKNGRDEAMKKLAAAERKRKIGAGPLTVRPSVENTP